jgi:hypothetical protein
VCKSKEAQSKDGVAKEVASTRVGIPEILETRADVERFLARLDEEAIAEEIEMEKDIAEAQRPRWWTFGVRTFVP